MYSGPAKESGIFVAVESEVTVVVLTVLYHSTIMVSEV